MGNPQTPSIQVITHHPNICRTTINVTVHPSVKNSDVEILDDPINPLGNKETRDTKNEQSSSDCSAKLAVYYRRVLHNHRW